MQLTVGSNLMQAKFEMLIKRLFEVWTRFQHFVDPRHANRCPLSYPRLGKAAMWAGAMDQRFAVVISNNSGEGDASLLRRNFGETIAIANYREPHRFCGNFENHNDAADELSVDAHLLVAFVAPRPIYIASASEDLLADPKGEFLAASHAEPVYQLLGLQGLATQEMPAVDQPIGDHVG